MASSSMSRAMVLLDRDGTVNVDFGYVHRWDQWQFTERAVEGLQLLGRLGLGLAIVTNQSGIARGYYSAEDVQVLHEQMCAQLQSQGVTIDAVVFCPHGPDDGCPCRKPRTGLATRIETLLGQPIDYARSWMIGDRASDLEFGRRLGTRTALIAPAGYSGRLAADIVASSLYDAAWSIGRALCGSQRI